MNDNIKNFTQSGESKIPQGSRNVTDFLPNVFKTTTNKKFLQSTLEHLMSSGTTEAIDAYWGKISGSNYQYGKNFYNKENSILRQNYQLAPGFSVEYNDTNINASYFNIIDQLTNLGYNTSDIDKLFSEHGYVLDVPINLDMFVNYTNYFWFQYEILECVIEPTASDPIDIDDIISLNSYTTPVLENGKTLTFVNGMRVKFTGDNASSTSGDYIVDNTYIVEGVGYGKINLILQKTEKDIIKYPRQVPYTLQMPSEWDGDDWEQYEYDYSTPLNLQKEYTVMSRNSLDKNAWSRKNQWVSIYAIEETALYNDIPVSKMATPDFIAKRPIIEFKPDLEMVDSGTTFRFIIDHHVSDATPDDINGTTLYNNNGKIIEGTYFDDLGNIDKPGDLVLFTTEGFYGNVYEVSYNDTVGYTDMQLTLVFNIDDFNIGDKFFIHHSSDSTLIANELYWDGNLIVKGQQTLSRSDSPLFQLYDVNGVSLNEYTASTFKGNSIFKYKTTNMVPVDLELNLSAITDSNSPNEYIFEFPIFTETYFKNSVNNVSHEIVGDLFYKNINTNKLDSIWKPTPNKQRPVVSEVFVIEDTQPLIHEISPISDVTDYILYVSNGSAYFIQTEQNYTTKSENETLYFNRNKDYAITLLNNDDFTVTDPYGNTSANVTITSTSNGVVLNISDSYEYDILHYSSDNANFNGYIFITDDYNNYTVKHNGVDLIENVDFVNNNNTITITKSVDIGDIIEFNYISDDTNRSRDVSQLFKHNPDNNEMNEANVSYLKVHFIDQLKSMPNNYVGLGINDYHKTNQSHIFGGTIKQQIYSPKIHSILSTKDELEPLALLSNSSYDYVLFKELFKRKVAQLWNTKQYDSVDEIVNDALKVINIANKSTQKYAHSEMAYYDSPDVQLIEITDNTVEFDLRSSLNSRGTKTAHIYVWLYEYVVDSYKWVPLKNGEDFYVEFDKLVLTSPATLDSGISAQLKIHIHNADSLSYIPPSAVKLGFTNAYDVTVSGSTLQCHDGSIHEMNNSEIFDMVSPDFDVVSAALYDLEIRISNNIVQNTNSVDIKSFLPRKILKNFDYSLLNELLITDFYNWKSEFGQKDNILENNFDFSDKFTWNYSSVGDGFASYKLIYKNLFGTETPDTTPWEILGYNKKPVWWDTYYSWTDLFKREDLINALKNGIINSPNDSVAIVDPKYAVIDFDWENNTIVTSAGELNDPVTAGIVSAPTISNAGDAFMFGDLMFQDEIEWKNSSDYIFSVLKAIMKIKPYSIHETYWKNGDIKDINALPFRYEVFAEDFTRTKSRTSNMHLYVPELNEVTNIEIINSGSEYTTNNLDVQAPMNIRFVQADFDVNLVGDAIDSLKIIDSGYGYQSDFNLIVNSTTDTAIIRANVSSCIPRPVFGLNSVSKDQYNNEYGDIESLLLSSYTNPILHLGGYSKKDLINLYLDNSYNKINVEIPKEDYEILLNENPVIKKVYYSGIKLEKDANGYITIDGYNPNDKKFYIYPVNSFGKNKTVTIDQNYSVTRYLNHSNIVQEVPYKTVFNKKQDLYNFILGLGEYYKRNGFDNIDWESSAEGIILWSILDKSETSTFYENGIKLNKLIYNQGEFGVVKEIKDNKRYRNYALDKENNIIDPNKLVIFRDDITTELFSKSGESVIYGIELSVISYEHIVSIKNQTRFGDVIYDTTFGIERDRIRLIGERTRNWNGKISSNGFIVRDNDIVRNYDSTVREIENDILSSRNKSSDVLSRKTDKFTVGYQEKLYFNQTGMNLSTSYDFSKGNKKYKGTTLSIDAFMNNNAVIRSPNDYKISEEWLINTTAFGDYSLYEPIQFEIPVSYAKASPQIVRFSKNRVDNQYDSIIDIVEHDNNYISGDFDNIMPLLPVKNAKLNTKEQALQFGNHLKTSGIPLISDVTYTVNNLSDMETVYDITADYANIPEWSETSSYNQGDIVRLNGKVYQLMVPSTGFQFVADSNTFRGNVTFPVVASGTTFEIGTAQNVEDEVELKSWTFVNSRSQSTIRPISIFGNVPNPIISSGKFIKIDDTVINFPTKQSTVTYENIVVTGSENMPVFEGNSGDVLVIDGVTIDMSSTTQSTTSEIFGVTAIKNKINVGELSSTDTTTIASTRLSALVDLLIVYPPDEWGVFISSYFSGIYRSIGLNIEYLKDQLSLLSGTEDHYSKLVNLLANDISLVNSIKGTSYSTADPYDDFTISPALDDLNDTINLIGSSTDLVDVADYISAGNISALYESNNIVTAIPSEISTVDAMTRINTALRLTDTRANIVGGKIVLTKTVNDRFTTLTIGESALNSVIGISATEYGGNNQENTPSYQYGISEIVEIINSADLTNVRAEIEAVGPLPYLRLVSTNLVLTIGSSGNPFDFGFVPGSYQANTSQQQISADLDIDSVINQINSMNVEGVFASNVNDAVVLDVTAEKFVIGSGTANELLGFQSGEFTALSSVSNIFNETEWNKIDDPIDFSILVQNNLDSFTSNTSRQSGYNVYSVFDFEISINEICAGEFEGDDALVKLNNFHNLKEGDFVVITGSTCSPNVDGIHKITSIINDSSFLIEEYIQQKGSGGKILSLLNTKFNSTNELNATIDNPSYYSNNRGWKRGMLAYVDSHLGTNIPAVYECAYDSFNNRNYFKLLRLRTATVDNSKIKNANVYNYKTGEITKQLEVYDPIKGILPGIVDKDIDLKSFYDSAIYSNSTDVDEELSFSDYWAEERVGTVWWDLSNAVYIDYEQSTLEYKQENWGKLYPTSTIDIYEWTKSPVMPDEYESAVSSGTVIDGIKLTGTPYYKMDEYENINYYWTEETKFNKQKAITETYYYFWVKNKTTVPSNNRSYSTTILENIIRNPSDYGIVWIAGVSQDAFLVSDLESCIQCENSVLQIIFDKSETTTHKEYILLAENDPDTIIPDALHKSLVDSISQLHNSDYTLTYSEWNSGFNYDQGQVVKYNNKYYLATRPNKNVTPTDPTIENGYKVFNSTWYELTDYDLIENEKWDFKKYGYVWDGNKWDDAIWDRPFADELANIDGDIKINTEVKIPDYNLHPLVRYNTNTSIGKTMFSNIDDARRSLVEKINSMIKSINLEIEFQDWKSAFMSNFNINDGVYNLSKYIKYTDWSTELYNPSATINYTVNEYSELINYTPVEGDYARILEYYSDNRPKTKIYVYDGNSWILVFQKNATIQFSSQLWNPNEYESGWDDSHWDIENFDDDIGVYIRKLVQVCRDYLFKNQYNYMYNDLWFAMLNYIHTEQNFVEWATKSTYIKMAVEQALQQDKMLKPNDFDSLIDFINDNKPFKSKLREIVDKNTIDESVSVGVTSEYYIQVTRNDSGSVEDENTLNYIISTNNYNTIDQTLVTTLPYEISAEDTIIEVEDGTVMDFSTNDYGVMWINGEKIKYDTIQGNFLLNCVRGFENTAPKSYEIDTVVFNGSFEEETYQDASFRYIL